MADFPEYQRSVGITPAEPVLSDAYEQVGDALYGSLEKLGMNVAKNASIERATIEGVKAGKKPGRSLFPAFTASDKAFVDAYKKEEYSNVSREAESFLNKTSFEAMKNPTPESLNEFQASASAHIKKLSSMITEENRGQFERDAGSALEAKYFKLANSVETENARRMKQSFKLNLESSSSEIQDLYASGLNDKAKEKLKTTEAYIRSQREAGFIETDDEMNAYLKIMRGGAESAIQQSKLNEAIQEGKGAEFLAERAKLPPTEKNISINQSLQKQYQQYNSMIGTKSHLAKLEGLTKAEQGSLSPEDVLSLKEQMTEKDAQDFDYKLSKINAKEIARSNMVSHIDENLNNSVKLSNVPGKALDAWLDDKVKNFIDLNDVEPSLKDRINLSLPLAAAIPSLNKQVENAVLSGNATQSIDAMIALRDKNNVGKIVLSGVGKEALGKALEFERLTQAGNSAEEAYIKMFEQPATLGPEEYEARAMKFDEMTKRSGSNDLSDMDTINAQAAKSLGFSKGDMPAGLGLLWKNEIKNNFIKYAKTWDDAVEMTRNTMQRVWGYSEVNGRKQVMFMPPEKFIPYPNPDKLVQSQLISGFKDLSKEYKTIFDENKNADYYFESDEPIELFNGFKKYKTPGVGSINIKKVFRDGEVKEGRLVIQSDESTILPATGLQPNYYVGFESGGVVTPIRDPRNQMSPLRYVPDLSEAEKENAKLRKEFERAKVQAVVEAEEEFKRKSNRTPIEIWLEEEETPYGY